MGYENYIQVSLKHELDVFVQNPEKPPWPTLPQVSQLSPDFRQLARKALCTAKLKLQNWTKGPVPGSREATAISQTRARSGTWLAHATR